MGILRRIQDDKRYQENLDWGRPRSGHPEGTIRAHIRELEANLEQMAGESFAAINAADVTKLRILICVHDAFKSQATRGVSIDDPRSHASLAAAFLREMMLEVGEPDSATLSPEAADLVAIVQNHDVPYALWNKAGRGKGPPDERRFSALLSAISDWRLFCVFLMIDSCTRGKSRAPQLWFFPYAEERQPQTQAWRACSLL